MREPNEQQRIAIEGITEAILRGVSEDNWIALLEGPAGSGKTFVIASIIERLIEEGFQTEDILISAPTHKARKVAEYTLMDNYDISVNSITVSALIGKAPSKEEEPDEEGRAFWIKSSGSPLKMGNVLIVDELSMIDLQDAKSLQKIVRNGGAFLLMVGDFAQLRPVKGVSIKDAVEKIPLRYKLEEVMRSDNPSIVGMSKAVRTTGRLDMNLFDGKTAFAYNDMKTFEKAFTETDRGVAIAYTNRRVSELNRMKRRHIYGNDVEDFMPKESVILTESPYFIYGRQTGWQKIKVADNNDILTIEQIDHRMKSVSSPFTNISVRYYDAMLRNQETKAVFPANVLSYDMYDTTLRPAMDELLEIFRVFSNKFKGLNGQVSDKELRKIFAQHEYEWIVTTARNLDRVRSMVDPDSQQDVWLPGEKAGKLWSRVPSLAWAKEYFGFREKFAVVLYEHASTAHKIQGSTCPHVFVDWPNLETIRDADDRQAASYVAVSRPSETLHVRI